MSAHADPATSTVDEAEVARFSALAQEWWNPTGKFKPLHKFNPVRLAYIKDQVCRHFGRDPKAADAFAGLRFLDIGCGGGLLSEPMARLGADVVGADPSTTNIEVAKLHMQSSGLSIDYRPETAEALAAAGETFDVILNMEVVEHVADVPVFMGATAQMVRPGGLMFIATINRTLKAYALAIVGAEYILQWLPKGTHSYEKLVRPSEIEGPLGENGMQVIDRSGVTYNPLTDSWNKSRDMDVNYMLLAARPGLSGAGNE
ncbi:MAG: bifunctional 2-polyprenyl-6-hydroxyphenol methylase/3-demethylubiquinol 3-O-methyltransferase UbiG [Roseibium sp.]|nr:bifunctional 2-polyprenyl-6-hydroxyphenol methylase/3-demethylubiquinol 3-O-methyltransferase UbiG [Roseibium sp.]